MASVAFLFLSPSQSRIALPVALGSKDRHKRHLRSSSTGYNSHSSTERSSVATKAGLGRFSGAIHGNSQRKSRRPRSPVQQQKQYQEDRNDNENFDRTDQQQIDEGDVVDGYEVSADDGIHDDGSPDGSEEASYKRYLQEMGVSPEMMNDVDCPGGSDNSDAAVDESERISHERYLKELRISTETYASAGEFPGDAPDDNVTRPCDSGGYQTHGCFRMSSGSSWMAVGSEGDLGYEQSAAGSKKVEVTRDHQQVSSLNYTPKVSNGSAWVPGAGQGDPGYEETISASSNVAGNAKTSRGKRGKKTVGLADSNARSESFSVDEIAPVTATVLTNPGLFIDPSLLQADETGPSGKVDQFTERSSKTEEVVERLGLVDGNDQTLVRKKQVKKAKKKLVAKMEILASSPSDLEESIDEDRVRVVGGGAERPFDSGADGTEPQSESRPAKEAVVNIDATTSMRVEAATISEITKRPDEDPEAARNTEYHSKPYADVEQKYAVMGSNVAAKDSPLVQSNFESTKETNIENNFDDWNLQDGPMIDLGKVCDNAHLRERGSETWKHLGTDLKSGRSMFDLRVETGLHDSDGEGQLANKIVVNALMREMQAEASSKALFSGVCIQEEEFRLLDGPVVLEQTVQVGSQVVEKVVEKAAEVASKVVEIPVGLVEQAAQVGTQMVEQVVEILPDTVTEQVVEVVNQVAELQTHVVHQVIHLGQMVVDQVSEAGESVVEQVSDVAKEVANTVNEVAETVTSTATQVAEDVTSTASQVVEQVADLFGDDDDSDSDDEFEAYRTSDLPEFRGKQGLDNFIIMQEGHGILASIHDFYTYMLKQPLPEFAAAMFLAPVIVSAIFTLLYLPQFEGLAFDETARDFFAAGGGEVVTLHLSSKTIFQVFMFSLSLSTGLQPELAPLSPYTLVVANLNALVAQLVFVFLSGAVFARLSQPSQPIRCSTVALVSTSPAQRKRKDKAIKVLMARYVLAGPQPCELVDVKVDLTYKYNTITRSGSYFRATQSLKLVRPEIAFLTHGMLIRHVIDETSPLYQRTPEMLRKEDAVFCLSVVGLERASMQSVFHVQHYCVVDNQVIWDAEFEDIILINKKNMRIVDHSRLSLWRSFEKETPSTF